MHTSFILSHYSHTNLTAFQNKRSVESVTGLAGKHSRVRLKRTNQRRVSHAPCACFWNEDSKLSREIVLVTRFNIVSFRTCVKFVIRLFAILSARESQREPFCFSSISWFLCFVLFSSQRVLMALTNWRALVSFHVVRCWPAPRLLFSEPVDIGNWKQELKAEFRM